MMSIALLVAQISMSCDLTMDLGTYEGAVPAGTIPLCELPKYHMKFLHHY